MSVRRGRRRQRRGQEQATRYLVLDTNAWIFHYGLGPSGTVATIRAVVEALRQHGYTPAYTSVTVREVRASPRLGIIRHRDEILRHIHNSGVRVGPGYWELVEAARREGVPPGRRHDGAIVIASEGNDRVFLGSDEWTCRFATERGVRTIYIYPTIV